MGVQPSLVEHGIVSTGVDYLTCSRASGGSPEALYVLSDAILRAERDLGNEVKPWSGFGYEGYKSGQFAVGSREDGYLLQLSGECSREHWREVLNVSTNVSRLDLQMTVYIGDGLERWLDSCLASFNCYIPDRGRKPKTSYTRDSEGGYCVYSGRRTSDVYLRAYDKGAESRRPELAGYLRCEAELKGRRAWGTAQHIRRFNSGSEPFVEQVSGMFVARGVPAGCFSPFRHLLMFSPIPDALRPITDDQRALTWLRVQVRPSVERLIGKGLRNEVLNALGLQNL